MFRQRMQAIATVVTALTLSACGGGSSPGRSPTPPVPPPAPPISLQGHVVDGPVSAAALTVTSDAGNALASANSAGNAFYTVSVDADDADVPLRVRASGGTDLVTGQPAALETRAVVFADGTDRVLNLNPFTTLIEYGATSHPDGLSRDTVAALRDAVVTQAGFGLTPARVADPASTPLTADNAVFFLKSSECAAQTARRAHALLVDAIPSITPNDVLAAIGADLTDGILDGRGTAAAANRITATWKLVSARVLLEAITNTLTVNGVPATGLIDAAIVTVTGRGDAPSTATVTLDAATLDQWLAALAAAAELAPSPALTQLARAAADLLPGTSPGEALDALPAQAAEFLLALPPLLADASEETLSRMARDTDPVLNLPPTIAGAPPGDVVRDQFYDFRPEASDPDGDSLSFSIANAPPWTVFDTSTGRLSGTPGVADVGVHVGVTIGVSDGSLSATLPAFDIVVREPLPGSARLSWNAPVLSADQSPLLDLAGFRVYYSMTPEVFEVFEDLPEPQARSFVVDGLAPGPWHFVITAYDLAGNESEFSNRASKTIE